MTRRAVFHCNAGGAYGMGHLMRSLAIAAHAQGRGWDVVVVGDLDPRVVDVASWFGVRAESSVSLASLMAALSPDVLHVDTYWLADADVPRGPWLVSSIQDGSFGVRTADLAIDPNLGAESRPLVPLSSHYLLGVDAAVIRDQVVRQRDVAPPPSSLSARLLVVIGGTDPFGLTARVVAALSDVAKPLSVTVVAPDSLAEAVDEAASGSHHAITRTGFVADLPALARTHSAVITAAGTSVWDFACMGVPMGLVCVTDNQLDGYEAAVAAGLGVGLGTPPHADLDVAVARFAALLGSDELEAQVAVGRELVDGLGTWRIVSAWAQLVGSGSPASASSSSPRSGGLDARPATPDDAALLHDWRNDPDTRAASRTTAEVPFAAHVAWLSASLGRSDRCLFVVERAGAPVGTVRFDLVDHGRCRGSGADWEVSVTVAPSARGQGLAGAVLAAGEAALDVPMPVRLIAWVRTDNSASRMLFERAGYLPHRPEEAEGFVAYARWVVGRD